VSGPGAANDVTDPLIAAHLLSQRSLTAPETRTVP
jgi:hypothetical protein